MNMGVSSPASFNLNTSNLFVEAWINFSSVTETQVIASRANLSGGGAPFAHDWTFYIDSFDSKIKFFLGDDSSISFSAIAESGVALASSTWTHVAVSYRSLTSAYIFINGTAYGPTSLTSFTPVTNSYPFLVGVGSGSYYVNNGYIRDLRVVKGGVVPVANFTPLASAPFSYASPTYVPNMGTTVFTLLGQFVTYNPSGKYGSSLKIQNYPVGGVANVYMGWSSSITTNLYSPGITVSTWIKYDTLVPSNYTNEVSLLWAFGDAYFIQWNTIGGSAMYDGTGFPSAYASLAPVIGTWYHCTSVYGNGIITTYINGSQVATSTFTTARTVTNSQLYVGSQPSITRATCAEFDDFRIYNTALTAAQVRSIYTQSGAPASNFRVMPQPSLAWDFNGTTTDYVSGLVPTSIGGSPTYVAGKYIQGLNFPNSINTGTSNPTNNVVYTVSLNATTGFTFAFWVNFNVGGIFAQQILSLANAAGSRVFWTYLNNSNRLICGGTPGDLAFPTITLSTGIWYHIALVVVGGNRTAYINGQSTTSATTFTGTAEKFSIGGDVWLSNFSAWCSYDDLRVYNSALSSSQIQSIYNQQGMPGRGTMFSNDRQIYVAPTGTYPSYTPTSGAQFPVFNTSNVSFYSSGGTSNGNLGKYLAFGSQTFNMSRGFSAVCQFAFTNGIGTWERIFDFGNGAGSDNILFSRNGTSTVLTFEIYNNNVSLGVLNTPAVLNQNQVYTAIVVYNPSIGQYGTAYIYFQGATYSRTYTAAPRSLNRTLTYVGRSNWGSDAYSNVNVNYLSVYNRVLTSDEINRPLPTPQITLKGAPLFNQLSQSAASSAVGAFSLRAVNGVTAKAVQVRAVPSGASSPSVFSIIGNQFSAPDQSPTPPDTSVSGQTSYNGTNQYTRINPLALTPGTTGLTISMAFKLNSRNNTLFKLNAPYPSLTIEFASTSSNISVIEYLPAAGTQVWFCNVAYTTSTNVYISLVISGTTAKTFVNNTLFNTSTLRSAMSNATNYDLYGVGSWNGGGYANMTLYDLRIQNTIIPDSSFAAQDFYADERGNLLTAPVIGTHLKNWLGSATGYVTKWYDQSGRGNDAIQDTAAAQPIIQKATKGAGYSCLFNGTSTIMTVNAAANLGSTNYTICAASRRRAAGEMYYVGTNGPQSTRRQLSTGYSSDTVTILNQYANALVGATIPGYSSGAEPMGYDFYNFSQTSGMYIYNWRSGASYVASNSARTLPMTSPGNIVLGYVAVTGSTPYFSGEIYEVLVFTQSLYDLNGTSTITQIYQNQLSAYGT
jgi:hypothetical protein